MIKERGFMKVLIIQLAKMGDIIQSFPLCDIIFDQYQEIEIYLLHSEIFTETLQLKRYLRPIAVNLDLLTNQENETLCLANTTYSSHLLLSLEQFHFDIIINLNSSQLAAEICKRVDCNLKFGFKSGREQDEKWMSYILSFMKTRHLGTFNLVDIFLKFLQRLELSAENQTQHSNIKIFQNTISSVKRKEIELKESRKGLICLQLGSRNSKRHPLIKDYAQIANTLINNGFQIVLTGVKSEMALYDRFLPLIHQPKFLTNQIGQTSLLELRDLLDQSEYLISSDTGTMHLASLTRCKIFAIFMGCAYPYETLAYKNETIVFFPDHEMIACYPCNELSQCPNHYICKEFNPEIVSEYILNHTSHPSLYKSIQDPIGQYLVPEMKQIISDNQLMALIWRIIGSHLFYSKNINLNDYQAFYIFNNDQIQKILKLIEREIQIYQLTLSEITDLKHLTQNFHFLSPLLIFKMIWTEENTLLSNIIQCIQSIKTIEFK